MKQAYDILRALELAWLDPTTNTERKLRIEKDRTPNDPFLYRVAGKLLTHVNNHMTQAETMQPGMCFGSSSGRLWLVNGAIGFDLYAIIHNHSDANNRTVKPNHTHLGRFGINEADSRQIVEYALAEAFGS